MRALLQPYVELISGFGYWIDWTGQTHFWNWSHHSFSEDIRYQIREESLFALEDVISFLFDHPLDVWMLNTFSSFWDGELDYGLWNLHYFLFIEGYREYIDLFEAYRLTEELIEAIYSEPGLDGQDLYDRIEELTYVINQIEETLEGPINSETLSELLGNIDSGVLPEHIAELVAQIEGFVSLLAIMPILSSAVTELLLATVSSLEEYVSTISLTREGAIRAIRDEILALFPVNAAGERYVPNRQLISYALNPFIGILTTTLADGFVLDEIYEELMHTVWSYDWSYTYSYGLHEISSWISNWHWNWIWWTYYAHYYI